MKRTLTIDEEIFINQFTQGIRSLEEMNDWFGSYDLQNKRDILHNLLVFVIQSHPTYDEIESSAISLNKRGSASAVKLLNKSKPFSKFGYEICNLPEAELLIGFDILLLTLSKADIRNKRNEMNDTCRHWWHKDLSNHDYLLKLKNRDI